MPLYKVTTFIRQNQIPAAPLIAASAMSAPAALAACKLCFPSHNGEEVPIRTADDVKINTSAFSSR
jgi:hypothetical protein